MPEETDRLDSWKQIAAYLQKSERTVRRWHETEGLPVHKHRHRQRGSVWTYAREIDEWLEQRRVRPAPPLTDELESIEAPSQRRRWMRLGMLGAGLAACAGAFWFLSVSSAPPVTRLPHAVALTALPGLEFGVTFSPDGKQVAFFWSGPGRDALGLYKASGIYIKTVGSESVTPLILGWPGGHFVYGPAWSPDGKTIAFLRRTDTRETWLCLVASSGGPEKRLIRLHDNTAILAADKRHLDWSLDSRRILAPLQMGERKQAIHWITAASAAAQRVTEPTASDEGPVASPDRQSLVFLRHDSSAGGGQELLLQKLKTDGGADGPPRRLMRGPGFISGVAWAPGGNDLIVCKREEGASSSLYRMPARPGGRLTQISAEECSGVEVSKADEKGRASLVYGINREPNAQLWKADLKDLEHGSPFAPSSRSDTFPAFSPDGTSVVFRSTRGGAPAPWIANQDGAEPHRLSDLQPFFGIEWSPDGSQILFGSVGQGLAIVPLTGGTPFVIGGVGVLPGWPHWSHGSGLIYYVGAGRLFQIRPDGSGRAPVGDHWSQPLSPAQVVRTSPDGKTLFLSRNEGLFRRPAAAEGAEELIEPNLLSVSIAATPTTLYYLRREDKALYGLSFAGGRPGKIGLLHLFDEGSGNSYSVTFAVSPDDKRIVWTVGDSRQVDLELIADFR